MRFNSIVLSLLLSVLCTSCLLQKPKTGTTATLPILKSLSAYSQDSSGAYLIFDGNDLTGWRGYNRSTVPQAWQVKDGILVFSPKPGEGNSGLDLILPFYLKDFEWEFEWKISEGGNSGAFYLVQEIEDRFIYVSAPEYQLLDNERHPDANQGRDGNRKAASLYDLLPAQPQNARPAGEWNQAKIRILNGEVTHFQNGVAVVHYQLWTPEWTALLQESKFGEKVWPEAFKLLNDAGGQTHSGFIGFQDHGDEIAFRNIKIRLLK